MKHHLKHHHLNLLTKLWLVFCCFCSFAQAQKTLASYQYIYDLNSEGKPSRCDCDYRLKSLELNTDSTFLLQEIKGRLDPKTQLEEKGTWKIEKDTLLVLTVKTSSTFLVNEKKERQNISCTKTFTIKKWGIWYYDEEWKGHGLLNPSRKP